jgi:hypothetical protein
MGNRASKGSQYERDICIRLSLWWTYGRRDDIFWRSSGSGARAKIRGRRGKRTEGQCGDIAAIDPTGQPLIDMMTIEIKRGYSKQTIQDVLDRSPTHKSQWWEEVVNQAVESHEQAGSYAWAVIIKRDCREPWIFMPNYLRDSLQDEGAEIQDCPSVSILAEFRPVGVIRLFGFPLEAFLKGVQSEHILRLSKVA